jgi:hypothetical protein
MDALVLAIAERRPRGGSRVALQRLIRCSIYGEEGSPSTDFSARFRGREELVGLYAVAARQADILSEYLCLYRVLEAADGQNGKAFSSAKLGDLLATHFGDLRVIGLDLEYDTAPNVFGVYKERSRRELESLASEGVHDVPKYLYEIRNSLAHGKHDVLTARSGERFARAARALPILKLLARTAVEA